MYLRRFYIVIIIVSSTKWKKNVMIIKKPLKRLLYSAVSDLSNIDFINLVV